MPSFPSHDALRRVLDTCVSRRGLSERLGMKSAKSLQFIMARWNCEIVTSQISHEYMLYDNMPENKLKEGGMIDGPSYIDFVNFRYRLKFKTSQILTCNSRTYSQGSQIYGLGSQA